MGKLKSKATKQQIKEFRWAYDQMEKGVLYCLFMNEEILKNEDAPRKLNTSINQRVSPVTGNPFITKAYFCARCGEFFIEHQKQINLCEKCNRKRNAKNWRVGGVKYKKRLNGIKPENIIPCYRCDHLLDRKYNCTLQTCESFGFQFRDERPREMV